jgi:hypothetical protein
MSLPYRKIATDAVWGLLTSGFNSKIDALAVSYNQVPFVVSFDDSSNSFALSGISDATLEVSRLQDFNPVSGCLSTKEAKGTANPKGFAFSGVVEVAIHWWVRHRDGAEGFDTESILNMTDDATISLLTDPLVQWPAGVLYGGEFVSGRDAMAPLSDGWGQHIWVQIMLEIYIMEG